MSTIISQKRMRQLAEISRRYRGLSVCSKSSSMAFLALLLVLLTQARGALAQSEGSVVLNYLTGTIMASGTFHVPDERSESGLEAEMAARRNGMERLEQVISERCSAEEVNPEWRKLVRSVGSEIYSDRTLRILLRGGIKDLLPSLQGRRTELLLTDGKSPTFRILTTIPFLATSCGTVYLRLPNGDKVAVVPFRKRAGSADSPVISLGFNTRQVALEGSTEKDRALLSQTNLFEYTSDQSGSLRDAISLPVVN